MMSVVTVTTIEELKKAKEKGASDIYVKGKLAHDLTIFSKKSPTA